MSELNDATIRKLKVAELREELSKRNCSILGKKDELTSRLLELIHHGLDQSVSDDDDSDMAENGEGELKDIKCNGNNTSKKRCDDHFDGSFFLTFWMEYQHLINLHSNLHYHAFNLLDQSVILTLK